MDVNGCRVTVVGMGVSGIGAAGFLKRRGAVVTLTDRLGEAELAAEAAKMRNQGILLELGGHRQDAFTSADLIVVSPGAPHTLPEIEAARARGIPVWGEVELASRFIRAPIAAVTGTNGKTTVTTLLGNMLMESGLKVVVGGNIGAPLIAYADRQTPCDAVVAEISSFQLDTVDAFRPRVAVLLNITEDHLDRYANMKAYAESKARIFRNQTREDTAVINRNDPGARNMTTDIASRRLHVHSEKEAMDGALLDERGIHFRFPGRPEWFLPLSGLPLKGRHQQENIAAAVLAALAAGGTVEGVRKALAGFRGLPHRLEYVDTVDGVMFFDDSKATNIDAVRRALETFDRPVRLIMGGLDKGGDYRLLEKAIRDKVRQVFVLGRAAPLIHDALGKTVPVVPVRTMEEAVRKAWRASRPGDVVLLSPACASFDMFEGYAHRGRVFCENAAKLKKNGTCGRKN